MGTFINEPADMQWLADVHTKGEIYGSAMIHGNEDCPESVECWKDAEPNYDQTPDAVWHRNDGDGELYLRS